MSAGLAFLSERQLDYGRRLALLRWRRAFQCQMVLELSLADSAEGFAGADAWVVVREEAALPAAPFGFPNLVAGQVLAAASVVQTEPRFVHTLREFQAARLHATEQDDARVEPPAICFLTADCPPRRDETAAAYWQRLLARPRRPRSDPAFAALAFADPFEWERPELTGLIPVDATRLLDVGCGGGAASATLKQRNPALHVTGIERDPLAATRARARLDSVLEGNALERLEELAAGTERFDAFLFADVLEHLEDPITALTFARSVAVPGARLVASVPNVGHLSLVRDLLFGRFDPLPAGLVDAGHLRWFTRRTLEEALAEAGWSVERLEGLPGAPPPEAETFRSHFADWPDLDETGLMTYQWVVVARLAEESAPGA